MKSTLILIISLFKITISNQQKENLRILQSSTNNYSYSSISATQSITTTGQTISSDLTASAADTSVVYVSS